MISWSYDRHRHEATVATVAMLASVRGEIYYDPLPTPPPNNR